MEYVLIVLALIAAFLLIAVVLIQPGKGDLATGMGGVSGQMGSMIGMRRAADFLVKTTIILAVVIMVLTIATNLLVNGAKVSSSSGPAPVSSGAEIPTSSPAPAPAPAPPSNTPAAPQGK